MRASGVVALSTAGTRSRVGVALAALEAAGVLTPSAVFRDNLIVVAPKERRVRIEVGYDLEQWITDGYAGETIREFESTARNIESCFHKISSRYVQAFAEIDDEYLRERAGLDTSSLTETTALFTSNKLDSVSLVDLIVFVETELGVRIEPEEVVIENFDSVAQILRFASNKKPA